MQDGHAGLIVSIALCPVPFLTPPFREGSLFRGSLSAQAISFISPDGEASGERARASLS
jgi:hypothetical protein